VSPILIISQNIKMVV